MHGLAIGSVANEMQHLIKRLSCGIYRSL